MATETMQLNAFQERLLAIPETFDVFLGGGRGGGKSYGLALLALRHAEQYGTRARMLYLRKSYKGLADFELSAGNYSALSMERLLAITLLSMSGAFPNGAYLELGQLETHADYTKYQGRSFTLLMVDEADSIATPLARHDAVEPARV